jgi:hypothetical protein
MVECRTVKMQTKNWMGWEGVERDGEHKLIANRNEMDIGLGREAGMAINVVFCQTQCTSRDGKVDKPDWSR